MVAIIYSIIDYQTKWISSQSAAVAVSPGTQYQFSDYFRSVWKKNSHQFPTMRYQDCCTRLWNILTAKRMTQTSHKYASW